MAYDALDSYVVMFGGFCKSPCGDNFGDSSTTWAFESGNWTEILPTGHPPARRDTAMVFDPVDEAVVLFGGVNDTAGGALNDTWEYARGQWTEVDSTQGPPKEYESTSLCFDSSEKYVLLFDGLGNPWEFRGGDWTELFPKSSPPSLTLSTSVYDPRENSVLLFGGYTGNENATNYTWMFSGDNWTRLEPEISPAARWMMLASFDEADNYPLFYGGWNNESTSIIVYNDTWAWTAPQLNLGSNRASADVGQLVNVTVVAQSPAANFSYAWTVSSDGSGCSISENWSIQCDPTLPGNYNLTAKVTDGDGANSVSTLNFTVFSDPTTAPPSPSPVVTDAGQTVTFTTSASGGTGVYPDYIWSGLANSSCTNLSTFRVLCRFTQPALLSIRVSVSDSNDFTSLPSAVTLFRVHPGVTASTPTPSRTTVDVGQNVTFSTVGSGGSGVYIGYNWTNLSFGRCSAASTDLVACQALLAGQFNISVRATDSLAGVSPPSPPLTFTVYPALIVLQVQIEPDRAYIGDTIAFFSNVTGGSPGAQVNWRGLPSGCPNSSASIIGCQVNTPGSYTVTTTTIDSDGATVAAGPALLLVVTHPTIQYFVASPSHMALGDSLTFSVIMAGGVNPYTYTFRGLPDGCTGRDAASWSCTPNVTGTFTVGLIATDQLGGAAFGNVTMIVTAPASSGATLSSVPWIYWAVIGSGVGILVIGAVWAVTRRKKGGAKFGTGSLTLPIRPEIGRTFSVARCPALRNYPVPRRTQPQ
jgi:hypothetical protein